MTIALMQRGAQFTAFTLSYIVAFERVEMAKAGEKKRLENVSREEKGAYYKRHENVLRGDHHYNHHVLPLL